MAPNIRKLFKSNYMRIISALLGCASIAALFIAVTGQELPFFGAPFFLSGDWLGVWLSLTVLSLVVMRIIDKGDELREGIGAMNMMIPLTTGIAIALLGMLIILFDMNLGGQLTSPLESGPGILITVLGMEMVLMTFLATKSYSNPKLLLGSFILFFIIDIPFSILIEPSLHAPAVNALVFMFISKLALIGTFVALGMKLDFGKSQKNLFDSMGSMTNVIFTGLIFLVVGVSIIFPAYFIFLNSTGGTDPSTFLSVQNPLIQEFLQESGQSVSASGNLISSIAKAIAPEGFEKIVVNVDSLGVFAVGFWEGILGLTPAGDITQGDETSAGLQILVAEIILFVFMLIALWISQENRVSGTTLKSTGYTGWLNRIKKFDWLRRRSR